MEKHSLLVKHFDKHSTVILKAMSIGEIQAFMDSCSDELNFSELSKVMRQMELAEDEVLFDMRLTFSVNITTSSDFIFKINRIDKIRIDLTSDTDTESYEYTLLNLEKDSSSFEFFESHLSQDIGDIQEEYAAAFFERPVLEFFVEEDIDTNILKLFESDYKLETEIETVSLIIDLVMDNISKIKDSTLTQLIPLFSDRNIHLDTIFKSIINSDRDLSKATIRSLVKVPISDARLDAEFYEFCLSQHFGEDVITNIDYEQKLESGEPAAIFNSLSENEFKIAKIDDKWEIFNEDLKFANNLDYCIEILNEKTVSDQIVIDFLIKHDDVPEAINQFIMNRSDFVIIDLMALLKIDKKTYLSKKTKDELARRQTVAVSKVAQVERSLKFQKYYHEMEELPKGSALSDALEDIKIISLLSNKIDDSVTNERFLAETGLPDCEFDSDAQALVSRQKLVKVMFLGLKDEGTKEDYINFVYNELGEEELMFQKGTILAHTNCPIPLLQHYCLDPINQLIVVRNEKTPTEVLEFIVQNTLEYKEKLVEAIKKHPNCTESLKERLISGDLALIEKAQESDDESFLDGLATKLFQYPTNWDYTFQISGAMRCKALDLIAKNKNSGALSFEIYTEAFNDAMFVNQVPEVRSIVINNKHCTPDIVRRLIATADGDQEFIQTWVMSSQFQDEDGLDFLESQFLNTLEEAGNYSTANRTWKTISPSNLTLYFAKHKRELFDKFVNSKKILIEKEFTELVETLTVRSYAQEIYKLCNTDNMSFYGDLIKLDKQQCDNILIALLGSKAQIQA